MRYVNNIMLMTGIHAIFIYPNGFTYGGGVSMIKYKKKVLPYGYKKMMPEYKCMPEYGCMQEHKYMQEHECMPEYGFMKLAHAYVPFQHLHSVYPLMKGLEEGTIFPELDRPYGVDPEYTVDA